MDSVNFTELFSYLVVVSVIVLLVNDDYVILFDNNFALHTTIHHHHLITTQTLAGSNIKNNIKYDTMNTLKDSKVGSEAIIKK